MKIPAMRIGHGYDVHRFRDEYDPNQPLVLGGCLLPDRKTLVAHSDGDVVLHAVCDAILGAIAEGDIGQHFPDSDTKYAGADSSVLLQQVLSLASSKGFELANIDITVVAQVPRLAPHRQQLTDRIAELLGLDKSRVNLKATTTEGLGYIGREEGIACHCVVLLQAND
jgi:2-C-methyl-D-erythritol 2,4-cyclodiphosphate synthase